MNERTLILWVLFTMGLLLIGMGASRYRSYRIPFSRFVKRS